MDFEFDTAGTVSVANGSTAVVGTGTNWVANYPGLELNIDGLNYPVKSVNSKTSITLVHPFPGQTAENKAYTIVPVHPNPNTVTQSVTAMIEKSAALYDRALDIIENGVDGGDSAYETAVKNGFVGTEQQWLDSLKGRDGSQVGLGAVVNIKEVAPIPPGASGYQLIVPVTVGDPPMNLTQTAQVIIPTDKPDSGIAIWAKSTTSGLAVVLGLVNAPIPLPPGSNEELDLSGSGTVYGDPGTIFPLGIYLAGLPRRFDGQLHPHCPVRLSAPYRAPR